MSTWYRNSFQVKRRHRRILARHARRCRPVSLDPAHWLSRRQCRRQLQSQVQCGKGQPRGRNVKRVGIPCAIIPRILRVTSITADNGRCHASLYSRPPNADGQLANALLKRSLHGRPATSCSRLLARPAVDVQQRTVVPVNNVSKNRQPLRVEPTLLRLPLAYC